MRKNPVTIFIPFACNQQDLVKKDEQDIFSQHQSRKRFSAFGFSAKLSVISTDALWVPHGSESEFFP